jgi:adenine-specific DNA methylase
MITENSENNKSFIEVQFPVSKISKESYKERKAGQSQTLTGLGKWWGRKPLILVRATILGLIMPAGNDPIKDRDIFLKILMMDANGVWNRKNKPMKDDVIIENLNLKELREYFEVPVDLFTGANENQDKLIKQAIKKNISDISWKKGLSNDSKNIASKLAFDRLSYDDRLEYCLRPEETKLEDENTWLEINNHLGTSANNIQDLMRQLGIKKFGYLPTVGDCFTGGGSIPFEAARIGLKAYASDLNPLAGLLTWAGLNILSLPDEEIKKLKDFQEKVFDEVCKQVEEWGIEKNEKGWMAKYYLYCNETVCPHCKTMVPMAPSWWVSKKTKTVAILRHNVGNNNFDIDIIQNATSKQIDESEKSITVKDGGLWCPHCYNNTPIAVLRRDDKDSDGNAVFGLRRWEANEFLPRKDDVFQERLYAIKYLEKNNKKTWEQFLKKPGPATDATYGNVVFTAPNKEDINNETKVIEILNDKFPLWQKNGYLPDGKIEDGYNTTQPIRERGWQYWHQLFNPRQLLLSGLFLEKVNSYSENEIHTVAGLLGVNIIADYNSKLAIWNNGFDKGTNTFYNQAINTQINYSTRGLSALYNSFLFPFVPYDFNNSESIILTKDARILNNICDFWITDPPYADAVNYHELTEFFLAWDKKNIEKVFPDWYADSKRILAVRGQGESFNKSMIEVYTNLAKNMPDNGMQVVMFTHQDPAVWADLTLILWSAGLHVTAAWNIATETESGGLKAGNYVQGTVILVLRKMTTDATAFKDEITYEIQEEVKYQIDSMRNLEDKEDPNFSDADYLLAAYAATLKILTGYKKIGDINVEYELSKPRDKKTIGPVEEIINSAIKTAYDYLIPQAFDSYIWKNLSPEERFFIKGMELEKSNIYQLGAYQEMARGFGVSAAVYKDMLASSKANQVRFKTPSEFGNKGLGGADTFSNTLLRQILMAIAQSEKEQNGQAGRAWLKNEVDDYWNKRTTIIELLKYLSSTEHIDHMTHWESPALYTKYLVELISNDGV